MGSADEPPTKKILLECTATDYKLCVICQLTQNLQIVRNPSKDTIEKFIKRVNELAQLKDPEFIILKERLGKEVTVDCFINEKAFWHRKCYSNTTNLDHLKRSRARYDAAITKDTISPLKRKRGRPSVSNIQQLSTPSSTITRSKVSSFNRLECFFCQGEESGILHACSTVNIGNQISQIVKRCNNDCWKVHYAEITSEKDPLSKDLMYHKICMTRMWAKYCSSTKNVEKTENQATNTEENSSVKTIAGEIEFFADLEMFLDSGNIISMPEVEVFYSDCLYSHGIVTDINRNRLKEKILKHCKNVAFTRPEARNKPLLIHSKRTATKAVEKDGANHEQEFQMLFESSRIVRKSIDKAKKLPWKFNGSLAADNKYIPHELYSLLHWIIGGTNIGKSEQRRNSVETICKNLAQQIIQLHKSDRQISYKPKSEDSDFRSTTEMPLSCGISLHSYHRHRSKNEIDILHHAGIGISYTNVTKHVSKIACAVQDNMKKHEGIYIPTNLSKNKPILGSLDNIDSQVDTPDGKNSFHGTAMAIYQEKPSSNEDDIFIESLNLDQVEDSKLTDVPASLLYVKESNLTGNVKPQSSPQYTDFKLGNYANESQKAEKSDMAWLLVRHANRQKLTTRRLEDDAPENSESENRQNHSEQALEGASEEVIDDSEDKQKQNIPLWAAYNSLVHEEDERVDNVFPLPIMNSVAHEWSTLITGLENLSKLNKTVRGEDAPPVSVWMDMDLYKRALKLPFLDDSFKDKWIIHPGQFHIVLCALRCLGQTIEGSGLDQVWVEADIFSNVTVNQIITGKHYNRAIEYHLVTLQALADLWLEAFFEKNPDMEKKLEDAVSQHCTLSGDELRDGHSKLLSEIDHTDLIQRLEEFDQLHEKYPLFQWARQYMKQVMILLQFIRATRLHDWKLHLASLEKLCVYFMAYDRLDYAQNIPEYLAHMQDLKVKHPEIWKDFEDGFFTVKSNRNPFSAIGVDHAQEHVNKIHKGEGGISGITTNPEAFLRYCLSTPILTQLSVETEEMIGILSECKKPHHKMSQSSIARQELYIHKIKDILSTANPFKPIGSPDGTEFKLYNIMNKSILSDDLQKNILETEIHGQSALSKFVEERICGTKNMWDKMTKIRLPGWTSESKEFKVKNGTETLKATNSIFARLLVTARSAREEIDLKDAIGNYEFSTINHIIMTPDGQLHPCSDKSKLTHALESLVGAPNTEECTQGNQIISKNTCIIFDGMAVVQEMVVHKNCIKSCKNLSDFVVKAIDQKSRGYDVAYVIFDDYSIENSLKDATRKRRTGGRHGNRGFKVEEKTPIKDFTSFLASTETKDSLTIFLANELVKFASSKVVTVTRAGVLDNVGPSANIVKINSSHEEADTKMMVYASEISKMGCDVDIYSSDTDVLVLAVTLFPHLSPQSAIIMGTGEKRRRIKLQPIFNKLGAQRALALCGMHAISGCDTTGHLQGKGKPTCFAKYMSADEDVIHALSNLGIGDTPSEDVQKGCEKFICDLFCPKQVKCYEAKELRWYLFRQLKSNQGVEKLPPTQGAIHQLVLRAHYQCQKWRQAIVANPDVLDPLKLGWRKGETGFEAVLTSQSPAPEHLFQLIRCGCKSSKCVGLCNCKRNDLVCTELCGCEADAENCNNIQTKPLYDEIDSIYAYRE